MKKMSDYTGNSSKSFTSESPAKPPKNQSRRPSNGPKMKDLAAKKNKFAGGIID